METKMDKRINGIAKAGRIISTIIAVFMIIGAVVTAIGIGITSTVPKDSLSVEITGTADVTAKGKVLESIAGAVLDSSEGGDGKIFIGDTNFAVADVEDTVPENVSVSKTDKGISLSVEKQKLDITVGKILQALVLTLVNAICIIIVLFMIRALMKSIENCETPFCDEVIKKMKNFGFSLIPLAVFGGTLDGAWNSMLSDVSVRIDFKVVFCILVVFMLVMIFSYGAQLQKESDETL